PSQGPHRALHSFPTRRSSDPEGELRTAFLPHPRQLRESLLGGERKPDRLELMVIDSERVVEEHHHAVAREVLKRPMVGGDQLAEDRKSTRLNSSHVAISYAVF